MLGLMDKREREFGYKKRVGMGMFLEKKNGRRNLGGCTRI